MMEAILKVFDWTLEMDEKKKDKKVFYLKSLSFLCLIVIAVSDMFWEMKGNIKLLLGERVISYILAVSNLGVHFFTSLAIIAFVMLIILAIIRAIIRKTSKFDKYTRFLNGMQDGSEFRFSCSVEDVIILLAIGHIFDSDFVSSYIRVYSEIFLVTMFLIWCLAFGKYSIMGVINRFFVLRPYNDTEK